MKHIAEKLHASCWVLIVDDDAMLADAYERIITRSGGRPLSVGNGHEATKILQNKHIDIVLLDLRMPVMDGIELLEWMNSKRLAGPYKIVMSNYDNPKEISRAYELGADRYVLKAWASPNDLIKMLNETLQHQVRNPKHKHITA